MCRLFGFRSALPSRPHRSLLDAENAVAAQSLQHPDGWGIGWYVDDDAYVIKSSTAAHACERFRQVSGRLLSQTFIVHVRRATVGKVDPANAHPFRNGRWLFAHNGTVFSFDALRGWMLDRTSLPLHSQILGDTDSEHLFFYLLSALERAGIDRAGRRLSDPQAVAGVVRHALFELDAEAVSRGLDRPIVNMLMTDGRLFIAHRAGMPLHFSTQKLECADATTCPLPTKVCLQEGRPDAPVNHLLVASETIGAENRWEILPDGATLLLDAGFRLALVPPPPGWAVPEVPVSYRR